MDGARQPGQAPVDLGGLRGDRLHARDVAPDHTHP